MPGGQERAGTSTWSRLSSRGGTSWPGSGLLVDTPTRIEYSYAPVGARETSRSSEIDSPTWSRRRKSCRSGSTTCDISSPGPSSGGPRDGDSEIARTQGALHVGSPHRVEVERSGRRWLSCRAQMRHKSISGANGSTKDGRRKSPSEEFVEAKAWRRIGPGGPPGLQNQRGA